MKTKKELAVAALEAGTVIDHIPSDALFQAVRILGLPDIHSAVTIGYNLDSHKLGRKGIIKVADITFAPDIIDRIALIAPTAVVNIVRDYNVVSKRPVQLPPMLVNIVKCDNPRCITNHEKVPTKFAVEERGQNEGTILRCHYCNHTVTASKAQIL